MTPAAPTSSNGQDIVLPLLSVYELSADRFDQARPLYERAWFDEMYINPVLDRTQPGRIFVDHPEAPTAAILFHPYEFFVAGSTESRALREFIKDAPIETGAFAVFGGFAPLSKAWETALWQDSQHRLEILTRCNFRWAGAQIMDWRTHLPAGATLVPMDSTLAERADREWNYGTAHLWGSYDRFVRESYGFCLLMGDALGSIAIADGLDSRSANIGVQTGKDFRRRGLARLVCSAFIEHTLARGLLPSWDCEERNEGSFALAQRLGFVEAERFSHLIFPNYGPPTLSVGLWRLDSTADGATRWVKDS